MKNIWVIGGFLTRPQHLLPHKNMYESLFPGTNVTVFSYTVLEGLLSQPKSYYERVFKTDSFPDVIHCISGGIFKYGDGRMREYPHPHKLIVESGPIAATEEAVVNFGRQRFGLHGDLWDRTYSPVMTSAIRGIWKYSNSDPSKYMERIHDDLADPTLTQLFLIGKHDPYLDHKYLKSIRHPHHTWKHFDTDNHGRLIRQEGYKDLIHSFLLGKKL